MESRILDVCLIISQFVEHYFSCNSVLVLLYHLVQRINNFYRLFKYLWILFPFFFFSEVFIYLRKRESMSGEEGQREKQTFGCAGSPTWGWTPGPRDRDPSGRQLLHRLNHHLHHHHQGPHLVSLLECQLWIDTPITWPLILARAALVICCREVLAVGLRQTRKYTFLPTLLGEAWRSEKNKCWMLSSDLLSFFDNYMLLLFDLSDVMCSINISSNIK